ncbi:MAG: HAD family hydrolase [Coraliomargaritaceae bacterium]
MDKLAVVLGKPSHLRMHNLHLRYEGLVFDMDGTLADTMPTHYLAWSQSMAKHGIEFSEKRFYELGGVPALRIVKMLADEQGVILADGVEAVAHAKEEHFLALATEVQPVAEVLAIAEAHRKWMPMAIATGSQTWMAEKILGSLGILDWFGAIVGADQVTEHKPAPETFLLAAERIGVAPGRCHAFEDTEIGITAARSAGMDVIDVNHLRGRPNEGVLS